MPATRPLNAEPTEDPDSQVPQGSGSPFTIKYDKLVIAVGAYSQSRRKFLFDDEASEFDHVTSSL